MLPDEITYKCGYMTPIARAAYDVKLMVVKDLAARGADLNAKDKHGMTHIMHAAGSGKWEVVKHLASHGANRTPRTRMAGLAPIVQPGRGSRRS